MECEYVPEFDSFYKDELFGEYRFEQSVAPEKSALVGGGRNLPRRAEHTIEICEGAGVDHVVEHRMSESKKERA